ncbi:hypothetical protein [Rhizobium phage RHph_X66]|nr:hypothetical protein [Rhizobium phage RHph_X66]
MRPEDINTINPDGKAFNGNKGALIVAAVISAGVLIGLAVHVVQAAYS